MRRLLAILVLVVSACGSDDDSESPTEKCDRLVQVTCDKYVQCGVDTRQNCLDGIKTFLACGKAVDVAASFDDCIPDLQAVSCSILFPGGSQYQPPANCIDVILF